MSRSARAVTVAAGLTLIGVAMFPGDPGAVARPDRASGISSEPQLVVSDAAGNVAAPALSHTGRYLAHYVSRRDQASPPMVLRRADLINGRSEVLNPSILGGVAWGNYGMPAVISADGTRVAFTTGAKRLVANDTNGLGDAFVRDASTDTTLLVSVAFDGDAANGNSGMASLSKNGRYAVFTSQATDVVPGSTTTNFDVYRRDLETNTTAQVTVRPNGAPPRGAGSTSADVSADGNLVAFNSASNDLAPTDNDGENDLFIRDMTAGQTRWLSDGLPVGASPTGVVISPNGQWISSRWDNGSLHLTRVNTGVATTVAADGYALHGAFSSQLGRFVFVSAGRPYVRDLATGVDAAINIPDGGVVTTVTVSGNGQFAAYDWHPDNGGPSLIFRVAL